MQVRCKVCNSSNSAVIDGLLDKRTPYVDIIALVKEKHGEVVYPPNLTNHVKHRTKTLTPERQQLSELVEETVQALEQEWKAADTLNKPYYVLAIANLRELADSKPSQDTVLKAVKAIQDSTGRRAMQNAFGAFVAAAMEAAQRDQRELETAQEGSQRPLRAVLEREAG